VEASPVGIFLKRCVDFVKEYVAEMKGERGESGELEQE
tara:strand:- start:236 stop:349 length:114 start_codon:yes stop_codon:yes gene_type:complete